MASVGFRRRTIAVAAAVLAVTVAAGCSSNETILVAGYSDEQREQLQPSDVVLLTPGVTVPVQSPADTCPVGALDRRQPGDGPVRVVFWHSMTNVLETSLIDLTNEFNASQDQVVVELQNQNGYTENIDKFFQSSQRDRPTMTLMPEYMVQQMADSQTAIPIGSCMQADNFDTDPFVASMLTAYQTEGTQWAMPFNVSSPVLYYNRKMFSDAGLDPDQPPISLDDVETYSRQLVDSGVSTYGLAVDHGADSGGGWFLEQWMARLGLSYADYGNGREARATKVEFNQPEVVEVLSQVQSWIDDGLAFNVGANDSSADVILKLADPNQPAAMGITTSAGLGTVLSIVDGGLIPGITRDDIGVGPMPGPSDTPSALVGGASLYIVADKGDAETAGAWEYIQFLTSAQSQSEWASATGYVPLRTDAVELEPLATTYTDDPRFRVAFDQIVVNDTDGGDVTDFSTIGPILGPHRDIRRATAEMMAAIYGGEDVGTAVATAEQRANLLLQQYAIENPLDRAPIGGERPDGSAPPPSSAPTRSAPPPSSVPAGAPPPEDDDDGNTWFDRDTGDGGGWFAGIGADTGGWFAR